MKLGFIYLARNKVNGKGYVGKTTKTIRRRWREHVLQAGKSDKLALRRAIRKYGADSFELTSLGAFPRAELNTHERKFIAQLGTFELGYNLTKGGDGGRMCAAVRRCMSASAVRTAAQRQAISNTLIAYYSVPANKAAQSQAAKDCRKSPQSRRKLSAAIKSGYQKESTKEKLRDRSLLRSGWGHPWRLATLPRR